MKKIGGVVVSIVVVIVLFAACAGMFDDSAEKAGLAGSGKDVVTAELKDGTPVVLNTEEETTEEETTEAETDSADKKYYFSMGDTIDFENGVNVTILNIGSFVSVMGDTQVYVSADMENTSNEPQAMPSATFYADGYDLKLAAGDSNPSDALLYQEEIAPGKKKKGTWYGYCPNYNEASTVELDLGTNVIVIVKDTNADGDMNHPVEEDFNQDNETEGWSEVEGQYRLDDYMIDGTDSRYITAEEIEPMTKEQLRIARNEIYACHGMLFESADLQEYFDNTGWYYGYIPANEFDDSVFNEYEKANLVTIKEVEDTK